MALRKIREFGDEVLNKECKEVTKMTIRTNHRDIRRTDRRRRMFKPSRKSRNCYKTELRKGKSIE